MSVPLSLRSLAWTLTGGRGTTYDGSTARDLALTGRLAGVFVAVASLLALPAVVGPRVALSENQMLLVLLLGIVLAISLVASDGDLGPVSTRLAGFGATVLLVVATLAARPSWPAPALLLVLVTVWAATLLSIRDALVQSATATAGLAAVGALHGGVELGVALGAATAFALLGVAAVVARLRAGVEEHVAEEREVFEQRLSEGESRLRNTEMRYRRLIEGLPLTTYITALDPPGSVRYVSPQIAGLTGHSPREWVTDGGASARTVHPEDEERVREAYLEHIRTGRPFRVEYRLVAKDGASVWVLDEAVIEYDHAGRALHSRGYLQEISERRLLQEELAHRALHDPLTGLPNRSLLRERLQHWASRRSPAPLVLLYIDLDDFKVVNDSLGHRAGDSVLVELAARLEASVRPEDTVARIGGDEFAILLEGIEAADGELVAERVLQTVTGTTMQISGHDVSLGVSVGLAASDGRSRRAVDDVLNHADLAMYEAKASGKNRWALYAPSMGDGALVRKRMRVELARALDMNEFELHYQPVVDIATGDMVGAEALVRWRHPTSGLVAPGTFIDVAVGTGQIVPLGRWVLDEACRAAAELRRRTGMSPFMTFNLALRELRERDLVDSVQDALHRHGLPPGAVVLEITEAAFVPDEQATTERLHALLDLGVRLAIDDFGTGYSSLSYLTRVPADTVKLARPFIVALEAEGREGTLARSVVRLCSDLGFTTIGEGIETPRQRELLQELGCPLGQGFLFARPMPLFRLMRELEDNPTLALPRAV